MENSVYEEQIAFLESENERLKASLNELRSKMEFSDKKALATKGNALKRAVLFLNAVYGGLGQVQADILGELNKLNNDNLVATNERMQEAVNIVNALLPMASEDSGS